MRGPRADMVSISTGLSGVAAVTMTSLSLVQMSRRLLCVRPGGLVLMGVRVGAEKSRGPWRHRLSKAEIKGADERLEVREEANDRVAASR